LKARADPARQSDVGVSVMSSELVKCQQANRLRFEGQAQPRLLNISKIRAHSVFSHV